MGDKLYWETNGWEKKCREKKGNGRKMVQGEKRQEDKRLGEKRYGEKRRETNGTEPAIVTPFVLVASVCKNKPSINGQVGLPTLQGVP